MKKATAKIKYIRISPRKMVGICKLVRGKDLVVARSILMQSAKKGARIVEKNLKSAVANARVKNMDEKKLYISQIVADMGPSLKRHIPWSRGSARPIKKRMTHLVITLEERIVDSKAKKQEDKPKDTSIISPQEKTKEIIEEVKEAKTEEKKSIIKKEPKKTEKAKITVKTKK